MSRLLWLRGQRGGNALRRAALESPRDTILAASAASQAGRWPTLYTFLWMRLVFTRVVIFMMSPFSLRLYSTVVVTPRSSGPVTEPCGI